MIDRNTVAAIVAEYNPFHNGHAHHIEMTKRLTGARYILILMSSNFVQRGEPAVLDRYARAEIAILHGADAVFELPVTVSLGSAETFAHGAVSLAHKLGIVDILSFGAETEDTASLMRSAKLTATDPRIDPLIGAGLRMGLTFPEARNRALRKTGFPDEADLLSTSNNLLAVCYLRSLLKLGSNIRPFAVKRIGVAHDSDETDLSSSFASAKAIRESLHSREGKSIRGFLPPATISHLEKSKTFLSRDDFSELLYYKLSEIILRMPKKEAIRILSSFRDVTADMAGRIYAHFPSFGSFSLFANALWSKNYTFGRINRVLFHILFGITKELHFENATYDFVPYIRPLAIKKDSLVLLREVNRHIGRTSKIPLITRIGDVKKGMGKTAECTFSVNRASAVVYSYLSESKHGIKVYDETCGPFMLLRP